MMNNIIFSAHVNTYVCLNINGGYEAALLKLRYV